MRNAISNYPFSPGKPGPIRRRLGNSTRQTSRYEVVTCSAVAVGAADRVIDDASKGTRLTRKSKVFGKKLANKKSTVIRHEREVTHRNQPRVHRGIRRAQLNLVSPVRTSRSSSLADFDSALATSGNGDDDEEEDYENDFDSMAVTEGAESLWNGTDSSSHKQRCARGAAGIVVNGFVDSGASSYSSALSAACVALGRRNSRHRSRGKVPYHCPAEGCKARDLFERIPWLLLDVCAFVDVSTLMSLCSLSRFHAGLTSSLGDNFRSTALSDRELLFSLSLSLSLSLSNPNSRTSVHPHPLLHPYCFYRRLLIRPLRTARNNDELTQPPGQAPAILCIVRIIIV